MIWRPFKRIRELKDLVNRQQRDKMDLATKVFVLENNCERLKAERDGLESVVHDLEQKLDKIQDLVNGNPI